MSYEVIRKEAEEYNIDTNGLPVVKPGITREQDIIDVWECLGSAEDAPLTTDPYATPDEDLIEGFN